MNNLDSSCSNVGILQVVQTSSLYGVVLPAGVGLTRDWIWLSSTHQPFSKIPYLQNLFTWVIFFQICGCPVPFSEWSEESSCPLTLAPLYVSSRTIAPYNLSISLSSPTFLASNLSLLQGLTWIQSFKMCRQKGFSTSACHMLWFPKVRNLFGACPDGTPSPLPANLKILSWVEKKRKSIPNLFSDKNAIFPVFMF